MTSSARLIIMKIYDILYVIICRFGGNGSVLNIHEHSSSDYTYSVTAGLMRDEAVDLFRLFYNGENQRGGIVIEIVNICYNFFSIE